MTTTSPTGTKHNHNDAFNRRDGCPRCEEIAAGMARNDTIAFTREEVVAPIAVDVATGHGAMKGNYTLSQAEWDEKLHGPAVAAPSAVKVMCWLCAGPHDVRDCPDKAKAINGGGIPRATLRSMGLVE